MREALLKYHHACLPPCGAPGPGGVEGLDPDVEVLLPRLGSEGVGPGGGGGWVR